MTERNVVGLAVRLVPALLAISTASINGEAAELNPALRKTLRRPIALAMQKSRLFVANRDTGSISVVDPEQPRVLSEVVVGKRLDDVIALSAMDRLLAVDSESDELIVLRHRDARIDASQRVPVARFPVAVCELPDLNRVCVASLWSRQLTLLQATNPDGKNSDEPALTLRLRELTRINLPFAPLRQCRLDERHVLVSGAFGGQLAVVDVSAAKVRSVFELNGHNIRGMTLSPDGRNVVLAHQRIHSIASTTRSVISWGGVVSNLLQTIPVRELLKPTPADSTTLERIHGRLYPLGREGHAAGDPGAIAFDQSGAAVVALAGVHEVAIRRKSDRDIERIPVGRHPSAIQFETASGRVYVASQFDDSVSIVDPQAGQVLETVSLGPRTVAGLRERGEELFYDARLSLAGWFSCHSCHSDGHSSGLLNDNFGDGSFNTPKRILSLRGTGDTEPWGWTGANIDLHNQIRSSIETTMGGPAKGAPPVNNSNLEALSTFIGSLPPAPSLTRVRGTVDEPSRKRGAAVFRRHGCFTCHPPPHFASSLRYDVGIQDEGGYSKFNPPSLRGVSQRGPYFHDNRAATLREVLFDHDHDGASSLSDRELDDLIEYLRSL